MKLTITEQEELADQIWQAVAKDTRQINKISHNGWFCILVDANKRRR